MYSSILNNTVQTCRGNANSQVNPWIHEVSLAGDKNPFTSLLTLPSVIKHKTINIKSTFNNAGTLWKRNHFLGPSYWFYLEVSSCVK